MPQKFDLLPNNQLALDYYLEYVSLGGKKNRKEYNKNNEIFFEETYDIFVFGDVCSSKVESKNVRKICGINGGL